MICDAILLHTLLELHIVLINVSLLFVQAIYPTVHAHWTLGPEMDETFLCHSHETFSVSPRVSIIRDRLISCFPIWLLFCLRCLTNAAAPFSLYKRKFFLLLLLCLFPYITDRKTLSIPIPSSQRHTHSIYPLTPAASSIPHTAPLHAQHPQVYTQAKHSSQKAIQSPNLNQDVEPTTIFIQRPSIQWK